MMPRSDRPNSDIDMELVSAQLRCCELLSSNRLERVSTGSIAYLVIACCSISSLHLFIPRNVRQIRGRVLSICIMYFCTVS